MYPHNIGLLWRAHFASSKIILVIFPSTKNVPGFLYFTLKSNFPLYKLQPLVDFTKRSHYKNDIGKVQCQFGNISNQTPL